MSYSELASPSATRAVLERFELTPKYKLGQNFLVDDNVIGNIIELSGLVEAEDAELPSVLEIGPGIGTLSVALLQRAHVIAVEQDSSLPEVLAHTTQGHRGSFALIENDALKVSCTDVLDVCERAGVPAPTLLVANLPYGIAATAILDYFQRLDFLNLMTVMVQSEVADRIAAHPGSKDYGAYTVKLSLFAEVDGRFQVPPSCFMPAPHVESAVVRLVRRADSETPELLEAACLLADAAFAQRRKTIRNSMKSRLDTHVVDTLLETCGIAPTTRGETLEPERFLEMAQAFVELGQARSLR